MRKIFTNGNIYTVTNGNAEAFVEEEGKFIYVGNSEGALSYKQEDSEIIDLQNKFVTAGFNDSHMHVVEFGDYLEIMHMGDFTGSLKELKDGIRKFISEKDYVEGICDITGNEGIRTICAAEPIGPNNFLDIMVIAPCTGNTAAKLCNGITDTPVLMAAKAHMRNGKPLVISISTNDALGANFKNIGMLMNTKNVYFVPFGQDNCKSKPNSLVAKMELLPETIEYALNGKQIQPVIQNPD